MNGTKITVITMDEKDYMSLTDMLKAKDGDFSSLSVIIERQSIRKLQSIDV